MSVEQGGFERLYVYEKTRPVLFLAASVEDAGGDCSRAKGYFDQEMRRWVLLESIRTAQPLHVRQTLQQATGWCWQGRPGKLPGPSYCLIALPDIAYGFRKRSPILKPQLGRQRLDSAVSRRDSDRTSWCPNSRQYAAKRIVRCFVLVPATETVGLSSSKA